MKSRRTKIKHWAEGGVITLLYGLFRLIPRPVSMAMCAALARNIGPLLPVSKKIGLSNIRQAMPGKEERFYKKTIRDCWDNLGRIVGEFPHINKILTKPENFEIVNEELFAKIVAQKRGTIFLAAHLGNWEVSPAHLLFQKVPINLIARKHANPTIEWLLTKDRSKQGVTMISRTAQGSRELLRRIREHENIGALVDQYASDGVFIPFFGRPARTTVALAKLAVKYKLPLVPVQTIRQNKKSKFKIIFHPSIVPQENISDIQAATNMMITFNKQLENWVREHPHQWLWLHNRWKVKKREQLVEKKTIPPISQNDPQ